MIPPRITARRELDPAKMLGRAIDHVTIVEEEGSLYTDSIVVLMLCQDMCHYSFQRELVRIYPRSKQRKEAERLFMHFFLKLMDTREI